MVLKVLQHVLPRRAMETGVCRGKVSTGSQVTDEELGQQVQEAQGEACKENAGVVNMSFSPR